MAQHGLFGEEELMNFRKFGSKLQGHPAKGYVNGIGDAENKFSVDGKKYHRTNEDYRKMREVSDRLCREYGLPVIRDPQRKGKHYSQYDAERNGKPTFGSTIRGDIDRAIKASLTENEFYNMLEDMGYAFKFYSKNGKVLERPP